MNTVKNIYNGLAEKFPLDLAADFDNPGLLIGDADCKVRRALVVLDCDKQAVNLAKSLDCQLIITHHPVIFNGLKTILSTSVQYDIVKNNLSVISMHTNMDVAKDGVNECLCRAINLKDITTVTSHDGFCLKGGTIVPLTADDFALHIKNAIGGMVKYIGSSNLIQKVLVCCGSGGEYLTDAYNLNYDALVTADVKHNVFIEAGNCNIALYDAGHFNTEDVIIEPLKAWLSNKYTSVEFISSHNTKIQYL